MNDAIVEMGNQFSLQSNRNSTSAVTVDRPHPVELLNSERYISKRVHAKKIYNIFNNIIFTKYA